MGGQHPGMGGQHPNMGGQHPNMGGQHPVMGGQHPAMGGQHPTLPPHYRHHMAKEQEHEGMSAFKKLVAQMGGQESRDQAVPYGPGHPGIVRPSRISASLPQNAPTEQEVLDHMMSGHMQRVVPKKAAPKPPALPPVLAEYLANPSVLRGVLERYSASTGGRA